jgi:alkanesulfonate monooxygenase SsuD/methylene tetrahydromethanopterin reductase-like flavin-dependent oxidoreductase (luciferase family)
VEALGRRFDPMDVGVARAFYVAKDAEDKRKAVEARLANQRRMTELAAAPGAVKSSMLSFDYTLDAAEESAMYGTPDEIAAKLDRLRAAGIEHVLLNGAGGAVANLRRFAHEVMPAYSGEKRAAAE